MDTLTSPAEHPPTRRLRGVVLWGIMVALLLTVFLEALDNQIVTVAMPRIINTLHGFDRYTWVVTAYLLASVAVVLLASKLSDQFGRKGFLLVGTTLFLLGSLLSGAAQTMDQLIFFRAIQGFGSGIGIGLAAAVVGDLFPPEERASKQGLFGIVFGVANLIGPTLGGLITDHGPLLSGLISESTRWRWLFYLNLPFGLLALLVLLLALPASRRLHPLGWAALRRIDFLGAMLIAAATCCLLLGLTVGSAHLSAWTEPGTIGLLVGSVVLYALFVVVERKAAEPILPLCLFGHRVFTADALLTLVQGMALVGLSLALLLFLQGVLALSPTVAGGINTVLSMSVPIGAALTTVIVAKIKRYQPTVMIGMALMTLGSFLIARVTAQSSLVVIVLSLALFGLGTGTFFAVQMVAAQNAIPQEHLGVGTGVIRYLGQLGLTLGAAVIGIVVNNALSGSLPTTTAARLTLAGALQPAFLVVLALSALTLVIACFLKDVPMMPPASEAAVLASEATRAASL